MNKGGGEESSEDEAHQTIHHISRPLKPVHTWTEMTSVSEWVGIQSLGEHFLGGTMYTVATLYIVPPS